MARCEPHAWYASSVVTRWGTAEAQRGSVNHVCNEMALRWAPARLSRDEDSGSDRRWALECRVITVSPIPVIHADRSLASACYQTE